MDEDFFIKAASLVTGVVGTGLGVFNFVQARKATLPVFEGSWRETTAADALIQIAIKNRRPWSITIGDVRVGKPSDTNTALFDRFGEGVPPDMYASQLPTDLRLTVRQGADAGFSFLVHGRPTKDFEVHVDWWDGGSTPRRRRSKVRLPIAMLPTEKVDLDEYAPPKPGS
ncbi:MAG: hypothetical protein EXQ95_12445 [Alphaproteobacteria bacterium]|nr:hypothetical protein [Alphaproteobacteria bacterium]